MNNENFYSVNFIEVFENENNFIFNFMQELRDIIKFFIDQEIGEIQMIFLKYNKILVELRVIFRCFKLKCIGFFIVYC